MLASPSGLGPGLALLSGVPAAGRGWRSYVGGHQVFQLCLGLAASGPSAGHERRGGPAADQQRLCAAGERLQQGRVRGVQRGGLPADTASTW